MTTDVHNFYITSMVNSVRRMLQNRLTIRGLMLRVGSQMLSPWQYRQYVVSFLEGVEFDASPTLLMQKLRSCQPQEARALITDVLGEACGILGYNIYSIPEHRIDRLKYDVVLISQEDVYMEPIDFNFWAATSENALDLLNEIILDLSATHPGWCILRLGEINILNGNHRAIPIPEYLKFSDEIYDHGCLS